MSVTIRPRKKLIEVALPLDAINVASAREKSIRHGHPSTLHLWWARRPLAAARAVIFAQMVDDPSEYLDVLLGDPIKKRAAQAEMKKRQAAWENRRAKHVEASASGDCTVPEPGPEPTLEDCLADQERQRLFRLIEDLVQWENTTNEDVLQRARDEIWQSWRRTCAENADHPRARELFDRNTLPAFHDPFAGGGALPLEAQRLGLTAYASDLNPVAVLINKAMIEIPPKFAGRAPVGPLPLGERSALGREWKGAQGLAEDVRRYGAWMREEAQKRIGQLYPPLEVTEEMTKGRDDLKPYTGKKLKVIAWLWARTVKSPNPAFAHVDVPLASTFMLSTKAGKEAYIQPEVGNGGYRFAVRFGRPEAPETAKAGTSAGKWQGFKCLMSGVPVTYDYIRTEGVSGRLGCRLMAIVAEGNRGRVYLSPTAQMEEVARQAKPIWRPDLLINYHPRDIKTQIYGLMEYGDLFTPRQLVALTTFSDLVQEACEKVRAEALALGMADDGKGLDDNGTLATAYAQAVGIYLGFAIDKCSDYWSSICTWHNSGEKMRNTFGRQAIPMTWDFAEANPFCDSSGNWMAMVDWSSKALAYNIIVNHGNAIQADAQTQVISSNKVISSDPPYYDNIGYADLSDFFYVWLRRTLKHSYKNLFHTLAVPKEEELVATPYRHGSKEKADKFFLEGMTLAMHRLAKQGHPAFPVTIYYAFKQSENKGEAGTASTGWETFLDAVIRAGFGINGTWPMRTELSNRMIGSGNNALASSIVLVCLPRPTDAKTVTRREFISALKTELPAALALLQKGNIAPVDLAQSAIGPGMAVYTRFAQVLDASGKPLTVREALALINQTLDEVLAEQEGDFDADSRWALAWFEENGFTEGEYGRAELLSKAKNTSVDGMVDADIVASARGKVRLLTPGELPDDWDPNKDARLTVWEMVHHLIRALDSGESAAAVLVARLGSKADTARELAYRLYTICERKKRAAEALAYNGLVQSWPEIIRLAQEKVVQGAANEQASLFE